MGIVEEEADESGSWLELSVEKGILHRKEVEELFAEANQLVAITVASIKTARKHKLAVTSNFMP